MMMVMVMMVITYLNSARTTTGRVARDVKVTRRVHVRSCKGNYFPRLWIIIKIRKFFIQIWKGGKLSSIVERLSIKRSESDQCQGQGKICKEINSKGWKVFITFLGWQSVHRHHHHHHGHHYCHHHRHHYRHHHLIIGNRWWGIVTSPTLVTWVDWHYVNCYNYLYDNNH